MKEKLDNNCRLILQNIGEGIVVIGLDGKIMFINDTAKNFIGLPDKVPEGLSCKEVMNTDLCLTSCPLHTIVSNSCASHFININLHKHNSLPIPLCLNVSPLKDANGKTIGVIENFRPMRDIVEIIDSLEKNNVLLSQEKSRIDSIINSLADGVFTTDAEMRITSFNEGLEQLTGLKAKEAIGRKCSEVLMADNCDRECPLSFAVRNGYGLANCKERIVGKYGATIPVYLSTAILKDHAGRNVGLVATIKDATETERLKRELNERYRFSNIIGSSREMQEIFDSIEAMSDTDCVVLIQGESGTGKELIARAVHHHSPRRDKPFIKVNCAAIVEGLFESELFGHVKGAFTGAIRDKIGKFELADGGTIFLDEIGDMPISSQPKLLRVLQDGEFERVGDVKTKKVDVRVIAATNIDLREAIKTKKFREDLFYRLCVVPVKVPHLRERKEDIPLLVNHFLEKCALKFPHRKKITDVSQEAMLAFMEYEWPGNVRELENIIEHAYIRALGNVIDLNSLPRHIAAICKQGRPENETDDKPGGVAEMEKLVIQNGLLKNKGNLSKTAKGLGISRTTLWRKIKKYNLPVTS
ncbi:MAG: sigma 54-interacting transcriptional regulator [Nitrospirae bacterium]|nr:sigma 54-interacting transcriptional regulator [Nitrospirota bacterium]